MIRKILSFSLVIALLVVAGTACKKQDGEAGDKTYISDEPVGPLGGTVPDPDEDKDPCLSKGPVGVQALLLKTDCSKVVTAGCGDKTTDKDVGEECDDGNTKNGDGCSSTCKDEKTLAPGQVYFTTKPNEAQFSQCFIGKDCKLTFSASGVASGGSYVWPDDGQNIPDGFKFKGNGKSAQIVSDGSAVYAEGGYKATVKVCAKSDSSNCATQEFAFIVTDKLVLKAFPVGIGPDFWSCVGGGAPCKAFDFPLDPNLIHTLADNYDPEIIKKGPTAILVIGLSVVGANKDDETYKWHMTVDGKDAPEYNAFKKDGGDYAGDKVAGSGVFLYNNYPDSRAIMFGPTALGKTFKKVVVTVTNAQGGSQTISFPSLSAPSAEAYANAIIAQNKEYAEFAAAQKAKDDVAAAANDPCNPNATANKLTLTLNNVAIDGSDKFDGDNPLDPVKPVEVTLGTTATVKFTVSGGKTPVVSSVKSTVPFIGCGVGCDWTGYDWTQESSTKPSYTYAHPFKYGPVPLSSAGINEDYSFTDTLTITVTDASCGNNKVTGTLNFNVKYPELSETSLGNELSVSATIGASDTNNDVLTLSINDDSGYFYAYLNNNDGWQLDKVGDAAPSNCKNSWYSGVSQKCAVSGKLKIYTADTGKATGVLKDAFLHANAKSISTDWTEDLDVWIHTITVQGKYWEASYGDGADNITQEHKNITDDDGDNFPWNASGKMPWKRRSVPDYN